MRKVQYSEFDIVKKQIEHLYIVQETIPVINDVQIWNIRGSEIGERTNKFTHSNFHEVYKEMLEEKKYNILINDESMISFHYLFDERGKIRLHNLSYIPSLDMEIYLSENLSLENQILISKSANNYIRIDYDRTGKKEIVHTDVHMHFGIFPKEEREGCMSNSEFRIPVEGILYPYEFIYIILKYFYKVEDDYLFSLLEEKYSKSVCLEEKEGDKLILSFNRGNYSL
jgi:hypothetical protein